MAQPEGWKFAFRALRSRNYRLFFSGQCISLIGTWITRVATSWLVYRLTKSPFLLGVTGFAGQIPLFFLAPVAGVWVDRWNRHRVLVVTQILSMLQSLALAALTLAGVITVRDVILLMLFQGIVNAFDMPARQAFVVQMVDRADLSNAIALNSSMVNVARLAGPALAGVIIAGFGEGICFLADGISYLAVIVSLLAMRVPAQPARSRAKQVWHELAEGWKYVAGSVPIRSILLLIGVISLVGLPYITLMPVFASDILHGGPNTMGLLMAAVGVGALVSAVRLAVRKSVLGLGRIIPLSAGIFGITLIAFSFSRVLWLSVMLLLFTGFGFIQNLAAGNTILQTIVEESKRGRVMAYYSMAFQGVAPFGSLLAGILAAQLGAPMTLAAGGLLCLLGAIWFARQLPEIRRQVRPIYAAIGILPGPAEAGEPGPILPIGN